MQECQPTVNVDRRRVSEEGFEVTQVSVPLPDTATFDQFPFNV